MDLYNGLFPPRTPKSAYIVVQVYLFCICVIVPLIKPRTPESLTQLRIPKSAYIVEYFLNNFCIWFCTLNST